MWNRDIKVYFNPLIKRFFLRRNVGWVVFSGITIGSVAVGSSFSWMTVKWKLREDFGRREVARNMSGMEAAEVYDVSKIIPSIIAGLGMGTLTTAIQRALARKWLRRHEVVALRDLLRVRARPYFLLSTIILLASCSAAIKSSFYYYNIYPDKLNRLRDIPSTQANLAMGWSAKREFELKAQEGVQTIR